MTNKKKYRLKMKPPNKYTNKNVVYLKNTIYITDNKFHNFI